MAVVECEALGESGRNSFRPASERRPASGRARNALVAGACVIALTLGACTERPKTSIGAAGGAAGGGLLAAALGASPVGIAAGVILGGLAGGAVGNALDQRDLERAAAAQQKALENTPTNQTVAWSNPDSGHSGTYTPKRTYEQGGAPCREFQQTITVDGKTESAYGTACRQPDGSWKIQA